jgi:hypothetical protein
VSIIVTAKKRWYLLGGSQALQTRLLVASARLSLERWSIMISRISGTWNGEADGEAIQTGVSE